MSNSKSIKFIDLFGGIGGFRYGLEQANNLRCVQSERKNGRHSGDIKTELYEGEQKRFSCVWYCDKDKYAVETYNKNFNETYRPTDITKVKADDIPEFDMLCGGFPCQSFSIAGKRKGFQDIRGTMFFEIYRIASEKRPRLLLLENVKGLLSADDGRCFATILSSLDELGYDVEWQVLNSKNFGVPQNRERVFIIGHLRGSGGGQVFPLRQSDKEVIRCDREARQEIYQIDDVGRINKKKQGNRMKDDGNSFTLNTIEQRGVMIKVHTLQPRSEDRPSLKYSSGGSGPLSRDDGISYCLDSGNCQALEIPVMNTLTEATGNRAGSSKEFMRSVENIKRTTGQIRRLTPVECERLQGFPDGWTEGVSDTQRYKQLGNAVTTNVITAIGEEILEKTKEVNEWLS